MTSLPLRGVQAATGRAVLRGEKLALLDAGARAGPFTVTLTAIDDTDPRMGRWTPRAVADNARQAVMGPITVAYVGDLASGASAVSAPITNEAGLLQVSPLSDYAGLTSPGAPGEPARYAPSGRPTFARVVASGAEQAHALARWLRSLGLRRVALVDDAGPGDVGSGRQVEAALGLARVDVVDVQRVGPGADLAAAARDLAAAPAQAVVYAGESEPLAAALLRVVHERAPTRALFATSATAGALLVRGVGPAAARRLRAVAPLPAPGADPGFATRYRRAFGAAPPPQARYGYAAMQVVLRAIARAGARGGDRGAVVAAALGAPPLATPAGTLRIGPRGDAQGGAVWGLRARDGRLAVERLLAGRVSAR